MGSWLPRRRHGVRGAHRFERHALRGKRGGYGPGRGRKDRLSALGVSGEWTRPRRDSPRSKWVYIFANIWRPDRVGLFVGRENGPRTLEAARGRSRSRALDRL